MKKVKKLLALVFTLAILAGTFGCSNSGANSATSAGSQNSTNTTGTASQSNEQTSKKSNIVIGFSNSYNGNSFRQCEETAFKKVADELKSSGQISDYTIVESNNNASTQISQIENLILKKVSAIIIDPGSSSALDGAISKAKAANIPVIVVNDGPVTSKDCYQLVNDQRAVTKSTTSWLAKKLNGKGNVLVIRGIAGTQSDKEYYEAMMKVLSQYPDIKVVGTVYGNWTNSVAQTAVASILPSLPKVDAIAGQGGDAIGALNAFQAAGRPTPIVLGGNRGIFINWWNEQVKKDSSFTDISGCVDPASAAAGMYLAVDIVNGKNVPQNMIYPNVEITSDTLSKYVAMKMADNDVAMNMPTQDWVREKLETQQSVTLPLKG